MTYPTDYEDEEKAEREAARRERLMEKAEHDRERKRDEEKP